MSSAVSPAVRYDVFESGVVGPLLVQLDATDLVCGVSFLQPAGGVAVAAAGLLPVDARRDVTALKPVVGALLGYLHGETRGVDVPYTLGAGDGFQRLVQRQLVRVPYGRTWTYGELAEAAGNGRAMRAAASACARNPVPLIVPCHRVVPASGGLGRYVGGEAYKAVLLRLEGAV